MIAVIDYGVCNIGSVLNMLKKIGAQAVGTQDPSEIDRADRIILPGVGSYDVAVEKLRSCDLIGPLTAAKEKGKHILGICLGMQLLVDGSDEGKEQGLGWIPGHLKKFTFEDQKLKVPHMGWNKISVKNPTPLFNALDKDSRFYFVHSYYMNCAQEVTLATTTYGKEFVSAIGKDNVQGVQFHPEKSHRYGMELFKNFVELK